MEERAGVPATADKPLQVLVLIRQREGHPGLPSNLMH